MAANKTAGVHGGTHGERLPVFWIKSVNPVRLGCWTVSRSVSQEFYGKQKESQREGEVSNVSILMFARRGKRVGQGMIMNRCAVFDVL